LVGQDTRTKREKDDTQNDWDETDPPGSQIEDIAQDWHDCEVEPNRQAKTFQPSHYFVGREKGRARNIAREKQGDWDCELIPITENEESDTDNDCVGRGNVKINRFPLEM